MYRTTDALGPTVNCVVTMRNLTGQNETKVSAEDIQDSVHAPKSHWDNSHLVMFINGTKDDLSSVLGNLELGVSDGGPVVQDHDYVLGLWTDGRDIDGPGERKKVSTEL